MKQIITNIGTQFTIYTIYIMLIPEAESFRRELSTFLNSLKDRFSDVKDLQIGGAGGRPSKGGRGTLLKGSNTADYLC